MTCTRAQIVSNGENIKQNVSNVFNAQSVLSIDNIILFNRTRNYNYVYEFSLSPEFGDCEAGSPQQTTVLATISDQWNAVDTEIIYLDPRYDHVVYREHQVTINYAAPMSTYNSFVHYTFFDNLPITIIKTTKIISNIFGELESTTETIQKVINLCMNLGSGHVISRWVPDKYYSWNLYVESMLDFTNPERDGFGWSYPNYIHGQFFNNTPDLNYRQALEEAWYNAFGFTAEFNFPVLVDDFPRGSWAIDAEGNRFMSMLLDNGVVSKLMSVDGVEGDTSILFNQQYANNPVFYPIAPA